MQDREREALGNRIYKIAVTHGLVPKGNVAPVVELALLEHGTQIGDATLEALALAHMPTKVITRHGEAYARFQDYANERLRPARLTTFRRGTDPVPGWTLRQEVPGDGGAPPMPLSAFLPAQGLAEALSESEERAWKTIAPEVEVARGEFGKAAALWSQWSSKAMRRLTGDAGLTPKEARAAMLSAIRKVHGSTPPIPAVLRFLSKAIDEIDAQLKVEHVSLAAVRRIQQVSGYGDYPASFPLARSLRRHHVLVVGPTNSGKTHAALSIAASAGTATVLSPLRLLAAEHQDALAARGRVAGMVTGEESDLPPGATHVAQTVETMDPDLPTDACVIDEVQMLAHRERGWAWTRAVVGAPAPLVVMTGSEDVVPAVRRLVELCGETLEVRRLPRLSPLEALREPVPVEGIGRGDALIAFSRADVLRWKARVEAMGLRAAAVYGALSPEVRRREAARYRSGEADVICATDAIGMGLNLGPLRRVILTETAKFDGRTTRPLRHAELLQIAGRAGRFGHHPSGEAGVVEGLDPRPVARALGNSLPELEVGTFVVAPDARAVAGAAEMLGTRSLGETLRFLDSHLAHGSPDFSVADLGRTVKKADMLDRFDFPLGERLSFALSPTDTTKRDMEMLLDWAAAHAAGETVRPGAADGGADLAALEASDRELTAYMWLARRMEETFPYAAEAARLRAEAADRIADLLAAEVPATLRP